MFQALRLVRKSPLFSFYVIAPLALGIGLNGAIFMLLDAFLLRPLPVKNPENLVHVVQVIQNLGPRSYYTYDALEALRQKSTSLSDVIGTSDWNAAVRDSSGASRVRLQVVSGNFFTSLGVQALHGHVLTPADEFQAASSPPVVLSYPYWLREFHGDPDVAGKILMLEDHAFTIAGVTPAKFNGLQVETTPDVRIPLAATQILSNNDSYRKLAYSIAARLRSGVSLERARAETQSILYAATPELGQNTGREEHLEIQPIERGISLVRPKFASGLILLIAGVGLLLLMICANVGGLLLARASARRPEIAVRLALGATSGRLVRQQLTESLVLAGLGGIAGMGLAFAATPLLASVMPVLRDLDASVLTLSVDLRPDLRLAAFAVLLCVACALFAGFPPALEAARVNLQASLRSARAGVRQRLRWALVALQVALCTFLLAGAGLLVSTFRHLRALDPGFDRDHVVTFSLDPAMLHYTAQQQTDLESRLLAAVRGLPGIEAAGIASRGVMHGTGMKTTVAPAGQKMPRSEFLNTSTNSVSPEYFDAMGIPLLAGRNFRPGEPDAKPVPAIVNRAFVRRFFPTGNPIGKTFGIGVDKIVAGTNQVIGVVGDAKYRSLRETIPPTFYSFWQPSDSKSVGSFILHVRTRNRPEGIIQAVRKQLNHIDPRLPFFEIRTMAQEVDATLWAERLLAWLSSVFAMVAAGLAMLGLYATLAYAIAQSRREIGIRLALGARAADVLRLLSAYPLRFAGLGLAAGLVGFYAATPAFRSLLFDVSPADPITMAVAVGAVLLIALAATLVAAASAVRIDPAGVLREE